MNTTSDFYCDGWGIDKDHGCKSQCENCKQIEMSNTQNTKEEVSAEEAIPTQLENPKGLHQKYLVKKIIGEEVFYEKRKWINVNEFTDPNSPPPDDVPRRLITKQIDDGSEYFILRLDKNGEQNHVKAGRIAIHAYANSIEHYLPQLADDLRNRYPLEEKEVQLIAKESILQKYTTVLTDGTEIRTKAAILRAMEEYSNSQKAEEAIAFAEWIRNDGWEPNIYREGTWIGNGLHGYISLTSSKLYQLYKQETSKK